MVQRSSKLPSRVHPGCFGLWVAMWEVAQELNMPKTVLKAEKYVQDGLPGFQWSKASLGAERALVCFTYLYDSSCFGSIQMQSRSTKGKLVKKSQSYFEKPSDVADISRPGCSKIAAGVHEWSQGYQLDLSSPGRVKSPVVVIESFFWSQVHRFNEAAVVDCFLFHIAVIVGNLLAISQQTAGKKGGKKVTWMNFLVVPNSSP